MGPISYTIGGALLGLGARVYGLGIQKRNLFDSLSGHALSMVALGGAGYWAYYANERVVKMLEAKEIQLRKQQEIRASASQEES